jgi:putative CocE/NonD family hydrolase
VSEQSKLGDATPGQVSMRWGIRIATRDGIRLNATLYLPNPHPVPSPVVFTLTPYISQVYHDRGIYFAQRGYPFLTIDVRGRGNSEGDFQPFIQDANDGFDIVEWLAKQPYCNGKVAMWGGSYGGLDQWNTAGALPPHLVTIVPVAAPYIGVDFPMRSNIWSPYLMQWLTLVWGRTAQEKIFADQLFWIANLRKWFKAGIPFSRLDEFLGCPSEIFKEWVSRPRRNSGWEKCNPSQQQYSKISIPILTITGIYDGDQPGALAHYKEHLEHSNEEAQNLHYLVIGPWDHAGTRTPMPTIAGATFGPASLVDIQELHHAWYNWTMQCGPKPSFLKDRVAYYLTGAERWRYANTLELVTSEVTPLYLTSDGCASRIFGSGILGDGSGAGLTDQYVYDPRDTTLADWEAEKSQALCLRPVFPTDDLTDQTVVFAMEGKRLVYHSSPFPRDTEVSGFFRFCAWIGIDQPDTDFVASLYDIDGAGASVFLSSDSMRARYRESLDEEKLIDATEPLLYDFGHFTFVSRQIKEGHRLRLVLGPINSIYSQKNYNSGRTVAEESMADARPVTVRVFHDGNRQSVLYVPLGRPETPLV